MANRFETRRGGFADMAAESRKRRETFLDDIERFMDWKPIEGFLKKKLRRHQDAVGNPAYPALGMFKILLLQRWHDLSDQKTADAMEDRISFAVLPDFPWTTSLPTPPPSAVSATIWKNEGYWSSYSI